MLGKTIGEYQIVEFIGETENAIIYKGFQPSMNRYLAVKVLKPGLARDAVAVQQFLQQANLAAQMRHPGILPVFDSGQVEGVVYQAAQYIETGTVRDRLGEFYNPAQALALINGITEGLEYIHAQGYVHGNLKPSNIFLDANRRPLLADFGVPQRAGATPTPYLAPEQLQGGVVDRHADVYAMGVLLFEMLAGEAPPAGMVVSIRARRPDLSQAVEQVILKALAQNPEQRFQTASEFRNALDVALRQPAQPVPAPAPMPAAAPSVTYVQPAPPQKQTNWLAIVLGVLLVGALCVGGFFVMRWLLGDQDTGEATQPPIQVTVELPTREPKPTKPPKPTDVPPEPTQPPAPTEVPPEPTQPPEEGPAPTQPPGGGEGGIGDILDQICGSAGIAGAVIVFGGASSLKKRKKR